MNVLDLAQQKVKLRKVSMTKGGEWQGPCPGCGGNDRFHVWPEQNQGAGSYWCRNCEKAGDAIQFLIDFDSMSFKTACDYLDIEIQDYPAQMGPTPPQRKRHEWTPTQHQQPADLWQEKAEYFTTWAQERLSQNAEVLAWLVARGIDRAAAEKYRLGWNPGEKGKDIYRARSAWGLPEILKDNGRPRVLWIPQGLVIPAIIDDTVVRLRIRRPEGEPRYYVIPGSSAHTMHLESSRRASVVTESELDAIAVATNNSLAGAVAMGSSHSKPDAVTYEALKHSLQILVALDFDQPGIGGMKWWNEHFDNCDYWPTPKGKDPGEAYRMGIDLEQWITSGLPPALTIEEKEIPRPRAQTAEAPPHLSAGEKPDIMPVSEQRSENDPSILKLAPSVRELHDLLRNNPAVVIINQPGRYSVLRNDKPVGGRIGELVFRDQDVFDYITGQPVTRITGENFI